MIKLRNFASEKLVTVMSARGSTCGTMGLGPWVCGHGTAGLWGRGSEGLLALDLNIFSVGWILSSMLNLIQSPII